MTNGKVKYCVDVDADLDERFRKKIAEVFGIHRGVITKARNEAIEDWIKRVNDKTPKSSLEKP